MVTTNRPTLSATLASIPGRSDVEVLVEPGEEGTWGGSARMRGIGRASGRLVSFMDDDDVYAPGAFEPLLGCNPEWWHLFRMEGEHVNLWAVKEVMVGNVGTPMIVVPNRADLPRWGDNYRSDADFAVALKEQLGEPVWHDETVALIRPHERG